ncbi:RidA family protein [Rhodococcus sp. NPDC056960]|uniref:RidA family protein n=1 Tax=Rhodococcus sp. NPDC056960 TaxID=3345982 RepID=UPI00363DDA54
MTTTETIVETRPAPFTWAQSAQYSQGAKAGDLVFTSGQAGYDDAGTLVDGGFEAQARQVFRNIETILHQHGASMGSVVKLTAYLGHRDDFDTFKKVRAEFFTAPYPAVTAVQNDFLVDGMLFEADAVAVSGAQRVLADAN